MLRDPYVKQRFFSLSLARFVLTLALLVAGLSFPTTSVVGAYTITVCSSGCNYTTIQAAINAPSTVNGYTINVVDAVHTEAGIVVDKSVTIAGAGASGATVQADLTEDTATDRVFTIVNGATVTIQDMTVQHGKVTGNPAQGGGILNNGTLTLQRIVVKANRATGNDGNPGATAEGGGIYNNGTLAIANSTVFSNTAQGGHALSGSSGYGGAGRGGGIANGKNRTLSITASAVISNTALGGTGDT